MNFDISKYPLVSERFLNFYEGREHNFFSEEVALHEFLWLNGFNLIFKKSQLKFFYELKSGDWSIITSDLYDSQNEVVTNGLNKSCEVLERKISIDGNLGE